ncbi:MAG: TIGR04283 family arsenosugar biosynthesis glycosyltransferase [Betaproteobacteria bacterium]|nr:TIGR04283 family arsenosugar biosynthesis glycosyltransferase [Betaproteobacteria bacterium]MDE2124412.1 TIGR04283 family arsenosugar biosynthesis glycosyltransferase [Betaproteobacteria bacterium]MDE2186800.1 TIGR04283 family arsenosugar biosynthesis glycosyltransferase [Betaproteobacteria bacterium]MDE2325405.1 TIGR04283 family arsenosugar biosynthesis glycosyltransferase [Betaproteobacteria bacterium]
MTQRSVLAIIIPAHNEASTIDATLRGLQALRLRGTEVIVVDGGSSDGTAELAVPWVDQIIHNAAGRATQMNAGARTSSRSVLLFLHADTLLPQDADSLVLDGLARSGRVWGRFDVRIEPERPMLRTVAATMNLRSRISGICTGDQALFMTRDAFDTVGGFPDQPLMEDIEISRRLKRLSPPLALRSQVRTSGRRWLTQGMWPTITLMWWLRLRYFLGAEPALLARLYRGPQ